MAEILEAELLAAELSIASDVQVVEFHRLDVLRVEKRLAEKRARADALRGCIATLKQQPALEARVRELEAARDANPLVVPEPDLEAQQ